MIFLFCNKPYGDLGNGFEQVLPFLWFYFHQMGPVAKCSSGPVCTRWSGYLPAGAAGNLPCSVFCDTPDALQRTMCTPSFRSFMFPHSNSQLVPHIHLDGDVSSDTVDYGHGNS